MSHSPGAARRLGARLRMTVLVAVATGWCAVFQGCAGGSDRTLRPDSLLRAELGLGDQDLVYRVEVSGGRQETLSPALVEIPPGAWVEFVSLDWWAHEIRFEADSLSEGARAFLERTDQVASPPLVNQGERFVLSFAEAPEGRYPFVVEGNAPAARGVVVVRSRR